MTNTAQHAKTIRETLKRDHGWGSKQVSVRIHNYSMGSSIYVRINDPSVPFSVVEEIARREESVSRCEITGDILSGGNRYVSIDHSSECLDAKAAPVLPALERAMKAASELEKGSSRLIPVEGYPGAYVSRETAWGFRAWTNGRGGIHFDSDYPRCAAVEIAEAAA
jgi:hypothetical protein